MIKVKKLHPEAQIPRTYSEQAVGLDLYACLITDKGRPNTLIIPPCMTREVPLGIAVEPPPGMFLMVCSRSCRGTRAFDM